MAKFSFKTRVKVEFTENYIEKIARDTHRGRKLTRGGQGWQRVPDGLYARDLKRGACAPRFYVKKINVI